MNEVMGKLGEFVDKALDAMYEKGKRETIKAMLEIIDKKHDDYRDGSFRDNSITYAQGWKRSNEAIREAVNDLMGDKTE